MFIVPYWIDYSVPALVYAFALWKGSAPERIVGGLCALNSLYFNLIDVHWLGASLVLDLGRDLLFLAVTATLALRCDRWWLLVAAMTMLLRVATDVAEIVQPVGLWAFSTTIWTWNWIFVATLASGACSAWRLRSGTPPARRAARGAARRRSDCSSGV